MSDAGVVGRRTITITFVVLCHGGEAAPTAASAEWMSASDLASEQAAQLGADVAAVLSGELRAQPLSNRQLKVVLMELHILKMLS